jgi:hypothetical protein
MIIHFENLAEVPAELRPYCTTHPDRGVTVDVVPRDSLSDLLTETDRLRKDVAFVMGRLCELGLADDDRWA